MSTTSAPAIQPSQTPLAVSVEYRRLVGVDLVWMYKAFLLVLALVPTVLIGVRLFGGRAVMTAWPESSTINKSTDLRLIRGRSVG